MGAKYLLAAPRPVSLHLPGGRHPYFRSLELRPNPAGPMEAAGIDVFETVRNAGWEISTIPCKDLEYGKIVHANIVSFALLLIE